MNSLSSWSCRPFPRAVGKLLSVQDPLFLHSGSRSNRPSFTGQLSLHWQVALPGAQLISWQKGLPEPSPQPFRPQFPGAKNPNPHLCPWIPHWELLVAAGVLHVVWNQSTVPIPQGFLVQSLPHSQVPGESVPMRTAPYCGQESATSLGYCPFLRYMCLLILSCVDKAIIWLLLAFANANLGGQKVEKVGRHWSSV